MKPFFKNLVLHANVVALRAARENQRRLFAAFEQGVHDQARRNVEHVKSCGACKARVREQVAQGVAVPFDIRAAAGIGALS